MSKRKRGPTPADFLGLSECTPLQALRFIEEHGVHCRDTQSNGTPAHWAAQNPNAQVMRMFLEHGADMRTFNDGNLTPVDIVLTSGAGWLLTRIYSMGLSTLEHWNAIDTKAVLHRGVERIALLKKCPGQFINPKDSVLEMAAVSSHIPLLESLFPIAKLGDQRAALRMAARAGEFGFKALQFILARKNDCDQVVFADGLIYICVLMHELPHNKTLVALIEAGFDIDQRHGASQAPLDECIRQNRIDYTYILCLAGAKSSATSDSRNFRNKPYAIVRAIESNFAERVDPAVREIEQEYSSRGLWLIRNRVTQVCIALHSLDLPALLLCEVMQAYCWMWPGVKFHHYWNIVCKLRHFKSLRV